MKRNVAEWAAAAAGALGCIAVASTGGLAQAAGIGWETVGAFQLCLDAKAKSWIASRVELVVNEDPRAGNIDDAAVAMWATEALKDCAKAGGADAASEQRFMKYMAHWRDHIYKAADDIRRRSRPD
jgi:hypothetical protein